MSVSVDTVKTADVVFNGATSFTAAAFLSPTASATAGLASVVFSFSGTAPVITSIRWAAVAQTIVPGADTGTVTIGAQSGRAFLTGKPNPATGSQQFDGTWTNASDGFANFMTWAGTDTTTPFKNGTTATGSSATPSITVTSPAGDFAVGVEVDSSSTLATVTGGTTKWWIDNSGNSNNGLANYITGAGSTTLSASITSATWAYAACDVQVPLSVPIGKTPSTLLLPLRPRMVGWRGLRQLQAFPVSTAVVDTPNSYVSRPYSPTQWSLNNLLLRGTAQDTSSSAVETNPHWVGRPWPPQWCPTRKLRQTDPQDFGSSAVETNPHWVGKPWLPQWATNRALGQNTAQDFSSSAVETNVHFIPRSWPIQWLTYKALLQNPATDAQVVITVDDPTYFVPRTWPIQWSINYLLGRGTAQDFSSSAVETNPHWTGNPWPSQWVLTRKLWQTDPQDFSFSAVETNPHWVGKPWPLQWTLNRALGQGTAQDFSSSAVETNPHWNGKPWPRLWCLQASLLQNAATDVPPVVSPDAPSSFVPLQWQSQWNVDVSLVHGGGGDAPPATPQIEAPIYSIPYRFPVQWNVNRSLSRNTAQDFSSSAVETDTAYFIARTWAPQWVINLSLQRDTAQDFSSVAPVITTLPQSNPFSAMHNFGRLGSV